MTESSSGHSVVGQTPADVPLIGIDEEHGVQFLQKVEIDTIARLRAFYSIGETYDGVNSMHSPSMPGNFHPIGHWVDVEWFDREHKNLPKGSTAPLYVPLTSWATVNMYVHETDVGDETDKFLKNNRLIGPQTISGESDSMTFPYENLFYKRFEHGGESLDEKTGEVRLRKTTSVPYSVSHDLRLNTIHDVWDLFTRPERPLEIPFTKIEADKKILRSLLRDQLRRGHDLVLGPDVPLFAIFEGVNGFIKDRLDRAPAECGQWESDLDSLLNHYEKTLSIPATAEAVSTWSTGFFRSLRLPARRISGEYFQKEGEKLTRETRVWTEVFVSPAGWVPFDPLSDTLGRYPEDDALYIAQGAVKVFPDRELKIERVRWGTAKKDAIF